jgi:DNA-binding YbaB/EbfC family protein
MDFNDIMRLAGQLHTELQSAQDQASNATVAGEAGGGLVRVVMSGKHELLEVHIDPKAVSPSDVGLLEDLVRAAVNQASSKVSDALRDRLKGLTTQLGIDASLFGGGFGGGGR